MKDLTILLSGATGVIFYFFNSILRKYTRNKKVFPNDQSAIKSIYLAAQQIRSKWERSRAGWNQVYNQLYICFEDRIK